MRTRSDNAILFDEVYLVGIIMLAWFLFRLVFMAFTLLLWNICIPSALIDFRTDYVGIYWFMFAVDVFVLAWLAAYLVRLRRSRENRVGQLVFAATAAVFVIGNMTMLPVLLEWREVEQDPRAAYELLWADYVAEMRALFPEFSPPGDDLAERWQPCVRPDRVRYGDEVLDEQYEAQYGFWPSYEQQSSSGMEDARYLVERRLLENRNDGEAWAMKALVYANAVDFMALQPAEASVTANYALQRALEYAPDSPQALAAYSLIKRNSDPAGSEMKLRRCIAAEPGFSECHNLYGDLLRKTRRAAEAGAIYQQGLQRWPENGELHISYAMYLQETGKTQQAINYLRKFVARQPRFPRGHWHLAVMLYEENGDLDGARHHAVQALELDRKIWNGERLLLELVRTTRSR